MPHLDLTCRRPWDRRLHSRSSRASRRHRRGIVLIFVVVLLTLLAIMGTAYLATSRLDRQAVIGRGRLPGAVNSPLMVSRLDLDRVGDAMELAIKNALIKDLFNQTGAGENDDPAAMTAGQAFATFRQRISGSTYENYDAPGRADAWLASLLPRNYAVDDRRYVVWPWISRAPGQTIGAAAGVAGLRAESYFSDPRLAGGGGGGIPVFNGGTSPSERWGEFAENRLPEPNTGLAGRSNATIRTVTLARSATSANAPLDGTRVYPGLLPGSQDPTAPTTPIFIAGDADGDGIADGGLAPIALDPSVSETSIDRYLDRQNNVIYFVSYRVVDNSAKINLNTALTVRGDIVDDTILASTTENQDRTAGTAPTSTTPILSRIGPTVAQPFELRNYLADDLSPQGTMSSVPLMSPGSSVAPQPALAGTFGPNYGFFRGNVGASGLIRDLLIPLNQSPDNTDVYRLPAEQELRRLVDARFPLLRKNPGAGYLQAAGTPTATRQFDIDRLATPFTYAAVAEFRNGTAILPDADLSPFNRRSEYRSFQDLLEQQLVRRPGSPGGYLWSDSTATSTIPTNALLNLGFGDTASLASRGGALLNPLLPTGTAEQALLFTTRIAAPNFNLNGDEPWKWFPPEAWDLWYGWTQEFDVVQDPNAPVTTITQVPQIDVLDAPVRIDTPTGVSPTTAGRGFTYRSDVVGSAAQVAKFNSPNKPAGAQDVRLLRSPRNLFTTYNGVTTAAPMRGDLASVVFPDLPSLPLGMPAYAPGAVRVAYPGGASAAYLSAGIELDPSPDFWYPATKVSAASGTKEQLWRAYWSAMTVQDQLSGRWEVAPRISNPGPNTTIYDPDQFYNAFRSSDRWPTVERYRVTGGGRPTAATNDTPTAVPLETLSARQMALIRSAVAACNTIDLRDRDNDITAMTVDITDDNSETTTVNAPLVPTAARPRYYARVYGTEKQLVISGVYMQRGTAGNYVCVELYNPSDEPINLSAYRLSVAQRTNPSGLPEESKLQGQIEVDEGGGAAGAGVIPLDLAAGANATLLPGGYMIVHTAAAPGAPAEVSDPTPPAANPALALPLAEDLTPAAGAAQVRYLTAATLTANQVAALTDLLVAVPRNKELVLSRTRRADGVPFDDATNDPTATNATAAIRMHRTAVEDEVLDDPRTLVPVDGVDCRFNAAVSGATATDPIRFMYMRATPVAPGLATAATNVDPLAQTTPATNGEYNDERPNAWRCFYAGKFYDSRPFAVSASPPTPVTAAEVEAQERRDPTRPSSAAQTLPGYTTPLTNAAAAPAGELNSVELVHADFAWRDVTDANTTATFGAARARLGLARTEPDAVWAPVIPIQTFAPFDPYTETRAAWDPTERGRVVVPAMVGGVNYTAPENAMLTWGLEAAGGYAGAVNGAPGIRGLFHLISKFPFGSPFARDGDLMTVPYIGSYKIYRQTAFAATPAPTDTQLYEFVPLPLDAVAIVPHPQVVAPAPPTEVLTIGRFDPRPRIGGTQPMPPATPPPAAPYPPNVYQSKSGVPNDWAANLTDFVTARHSTYAVQLPDVPDTSPTATFFQVPGGSIPAEQFQDQRWVQDGPVRGQNAANPSSEARFTRYDERDGTLTDTTIPQDPNAPVYGRNRRRGTITATGGQAELVQGVLNLNTAPQIALRQLPFIVSTQQATAAGFPAGTGQVDFQSSDPLGQQTRMLTNWIDRRRAANERQPLDTLNDPGRTFGFDSIWSLNTDPNLYNPLTPSDGNLRDMMRRAVYPADVTPTLPPNVPMTAATYPMTTSPPTANELLLAGILNPVGRGEFETDFRYETANATRVSNLTSTRSDVYTVYVTVQAWSYVGNIAGANQLTDTRLVGERRTSFVVDRSKITQAAHGVGNLIVFPIERE